MKICMTVFNTFTHDARVYKEARTLVDAGHHVLVLARAGKTLPEYEAVDGIAVRRIPLATRRWFRSIVTQGLKYAEYFGRTLQAAVAWNADVYHAHNANTLLIGAAAARLRGRPLVYDAHEYEAGRDWEGKNVPLLFQQLWTLPERLAVRHADAVITVSEPIAHLLAERYDIPAPFLVRNVEEYRGNVCPAPVRAHLGIGHDTPLVLFQGSLKPNRGLEPVIRALVEVPYANFVVFGDGPEEERMRSLAHELGVAERVHFYGLVPLENLAAHTAAADIGVVLTRNTCLSHYYSLPNKLFQYIEAGLPILGADLPEIRRIVVNEGIGEVADPEDPTAVTDALKRMVADPEHLERLRKNTMRAATRYNWQQEQSRLLEVYESLQEK